MEEQLVPTPARCWTGIFTLPKIDCEVPKVIGLTGLRSKILARFVRASQSVGVSLPEGCFSTPEEVLRAQWQQQMDRLGITARHTSVLAGSLRIEADDNRLHVWTVAAQGLNAYRAKPVVERLEAESAGLGWFILHTLRDGHSHGLSLFDFFRLSYDGLPWGFQELETFSDDAYATFLEQHDGVEVEECEADEEMHGGEGLGPSMTTERMEKILEVVGGWRPSDVLAEVEGHIHLLDLPEAKPSWPRTMSVREVQTWLKANEHHSDAELVRLAIKLKAAFQADTRRSFSTGYALDLQLLGAPAFLCWDSMDLLGEMAEHMERNAMESGDAADCYSVAWLEGLEQITDEQLRLLARDTLAYLKRWKLLAELLSLFPLWEEDEL